MLRRIFSTRASALTPARRTVVLLVDISVAILSTKIPTEPLTDFSMWLGLLFLLKSSAPEKEWSMDVAVAPGSSA